MDENEKEHRELAVLHKKAMLPLFYHPYNIIVSKDPLLAREFIAEQWEGIMVNLTQKSLSSTFTIRHDRLGDDALVYICSQHDDPDQPIEAIIAHEANNLSWIMADNLNIKIDTDNYASQGYIVSELVKEIVSTLRDFEEKNSDIDCL